MSDVISGLVDAINAKDQLNDLIVQATNGKTEITNYMTALHTNEDHLIEEINSFIIKVNFNPLPVVLLPYFLFFNHTNIIQTDFFTNLSHLMPKGLVYPGREKGDLDREDVYVKIRAAMLEVTFQYQILNFVH